MNVKALIFCALPFMAHAQGFAGLGTEVEGFSVPQPSPIFTFPTDHGPHNDYRIEWWYLTANLAGTDGTDYGLQWTLFRSALAPEEGAGWAAPQLWMGHAAVTTPDAHYVSERLGRGGIGQAGVNADPFVAWIDDWELSGDWNTLAMSASGADFAYDMELTAQGPLVFHGDAGFSVKSAEGQASYYYSQPYFDVAGVLALPTGDVPVTGSAWLDREWSSQPLGANQTGWDWFSLSFDEGAKLMGFRLQQTDGAHFTAATWIAADGATTAMEDGAFTAVPLDENAQGVPVRWQVTLPARDVDVTVAAINDNAWMTTSVPYWEGPVTVTGSHQGRGYLEMTGYE
ncbi:iron ABC transporter permease [Loktanella sp. D2R18]|uniref:lipocalin-like domain-containing protein n=1 Tax=Rhodobacterales TaxID=204455 RepID=UPI000DE9E290|nr:MULTISPECIES: lipocalin-like domain-containing protein [Rhodobacterales]MDO6591790.1 lipocalin-like domain-containing protein [Yoonia sp. 1_MG-2023]RBW42294.1 iron ABC transporter permease [Loktanella sp. D2R18]